MKLFPYQEAGAAWLQDRPRAYLADAPGLGKTAQVIQALKAYGALRPVVICPASAVPVWAAEAEKWNLTVPLVCMSYDMLVRHHAERAPTIKEHADVLILDEAHYLKSGEALRTKLTLSDQRGILRRDMKVWMLSGTPSPNHYGELFIPLATLWPQVLIEHGLTTYEKFLDEFTVWEWYRPPHGPPRRRVFRSKNGPKLRYLLSQHDIMLRRTMEEVGIQLPKIFWQDIPVEAEPLDAHTEAEHAELSEYVQSLDDGSFSKERHELGVRKAPGVVRAIKELLDDDPTRKHVVMAYHHDVLDALQEALSPYGLVRIDGGTTGTERGIKVAQFQTAPEVRVFLGQTVACREAITLTASNMIHIVEPFWTPEYNVQLAGRVRRLTQAEDHVIARLYYAPDPLDFAMTQRLKERAVAMTELYEPTNDGA